MRFGRTAPSAPLPVEERPLPAPVLAPAPAQGDLSTISLEALFAEVKRRGWQVFPSGAWEAVMRGLEARAVAAEVRASHAESKTKEAVGLALSSYEQERQASRECSELAYAMIVPELAAFAAGEWNEDVE